LGKISTIAVVVSESAVMSLGVDSKSKFVTCFVEGDGDECWSFSMIGRTPDHRDADSRFFGGLIDDVRIYDKPLSPKEITELMK
jgi:hypothetical protein